MPEWKGRVPLTRSHCERITATRGCKAVNSECYTTTCLPEDFKEVRKNGQCRIILHHGNASCHISAETTWSLQDQKTELTGHPSYGPDLAPNDFYLFPSVKNKLSCQRFSTHEEAVGAFRMHVLEIPQ
ncbi:Mariner Mos1 transposase [Eumeta japonica]|uniref:Mariner Mos1 transposase n=1 Tax=Eumeta variegata TaxID=151549 RepID=A0A4C1YYX0_EUMVA|nr:Mariner Mos1 transposase [Eumeta japonica]